MSDDRSKRKDKDKSRPKTRSAIESMVVEEIEVVGVGADVGPTEKEQRKQARRLNWSRRWRAIQATVGIAALGLLAVAATLATRGFWPVDETRFTAIAWEMWSSGDHMVPRINGAATPTAPLFFWLIHAGWSVTGVNDWWPRILPGLLMIATVMVAARMARLLWPGDEPWYRHIPFVFLGSFFWVATATLFTPDFLAVLMVALIMHSLLWMWRTRDQRVWLLLGLWLGLGMLSSGSRILLYTLPMAMLAPMWTRGTPVMRWSYWYLDTFKALVIGIVIFGAWLLLAASRTKAGGGIGALTPIVTSPFASHSLDLFSGKQPWWWMLALLPVMGFPWSLWPLPYMRFWHIRAEPISNGLAFCMLWGVITVGIFMLSPVREPQLLLPAAPALLLAMGWLVLDDRHDAHDHSHLASTMIFPLMLIGALAAALPKLPRVDYLPDFLWQMSPMVGVGIIVVGVIVGFLPLPSLDKRVINMASTVCVLTTLSVLAIGFQFNEYRDVVDPAQVLARAPGQPIAKINRYRGEYHFAGRLTRPMEVVAPDAIEAWMTANPNGLVVYSGQNWQPPRSAAVKPLFDRTTADSRLQIWSVADLAPKPEPAAPVAPAVSAP